MAREDLEIERLEVEIMKLRVRIQEIRIRKAREEEMESLEKTSDCPRWERFLEDIVGGEQPEKFEYRVLLESEDGAKVDRIVEAESEVDALARVLLTPGTIEAIGPLPPSREKVHLAYTRANLPKILGRIGLSEEVLAELEAIRSEAGE